MNEEICDGEKALLLLKAVLDNRLSAELALKEWPEMSKKSGKAMGNAYHELHHYLADEDIRAREPEYAKFQRSGLQQCFDELSEELKTLVQ